MFSFAIVGQYSAIGDTATIGIMGWSTTASWSQWQALSEFLQMGIMPSLTQSREHRDGQDWTAPGGQILTVPNGNEGIFFEALLAVLKDLADIRLDCGGVTGYYKAVGQIARLGGGHWEPPEALGIGPWAEIGG